MRNELEARIASMNDLSGVLAAMRALAVIRMQEARQALAGIRRYAQIVAHGLGQASLLLGNPAIFQRGEPGRILVAFLAEHGFVGGFNQRLLDELDAARRPGDILFLVGAHGTAQALERAMPPAWNIAMATRVPGALETARTVAAELYRRVAAGDAGHILLVHGQYQPSGLPRTLRRSVLPLELEPFRAAPNALAPLHHLPPALLLERFATAYIFAQLAEAAIEALASENAARFFAMEAAHDNVAGKLAQLRQQARQERQEDITSELLEIVGGTLAADAAAGAGSSGWAGGNPPYLR